MRRQRTILQSARHVQPANSVRMQRKGSRAAESIGSMTVLQIRGHIRSHLLVVIGMIKAGPLLLVLIPPDKFLPFAPRLAVRARRGTVVNDAAVIRPCEAPSMPKKIFRLTLVRAIAVLLRKYSAVDPCAAGRRAVVLQIFDVLQLCALRQRVAVDFLQHLSNLRLGVFSLCRIIPSQRS